MNRTRITAVVLVAALWLINPFDAHAQQGEYGTIPSTFNVDKFLGEAQYSMQIFTPEGRGGLRPRLSMEYRHRRGDGFLGVGWGLTGFSAITRCAQTVAQDFKAREVRYDMQDRYCLDGARLILTAGTYGTDGSNYRTEIDQYKRIEAISSAGNGPREFLVTDRDGTRYFYGHANNSSLALGTTYRTWHLYRIQDRFNNTADFTWEKNDATGEHRIAIISYGGTNAYRVTFAYVAKPAAHQRSGSLWGAPRADVKRLTTIAVQRYNGSWTTIYNYNLGYVPDADAPHHSLLETVQQCGPTACLNGSYFEWADGQITCSGYGAASTAAALWSATSSPVIAADFNGDGEQDVATPYNTGIAWEQHGAAIYYAGNGTLGAADVQLWGLCSSYRVFEFNGDGRADLFCVGNQAGFAAQLYVKQSTSAGWVSYHIGSATWDSTWGAHRVHVADINGDGLGDLIHASSGATWEVQLNTGGAFGSPTSLSLAANVLMTMATWANMDDDAAMELVAPRYPEADITVLQHNGTTGQFDLVFTEPGLNTPNNGWALPDINGDGLPDLAYRKGGSNVVHTRLNLGNDFGPEQTTTIPSNLFPQFAQHADANNDGRADLFLATGPNGTFQAHPSNGTTFVSGTGSLFIDGKLDFADVTGDGHPDAIYRGAGSTTWYIHPHLAELEAITTFWDGFGNWQKPTYATISTMADYALGTAAPETHPRRFFSGPLYVVDHYEGSCPKAWCTSRESWFGWTRAQLTTADNRAG